MSDAKTDLVVLVEPPVRPAEQLSDPHPEDPVVGKWYWMRLKGWKEKETELACVVHIGSNFVKMRTVSESPYRVHVDNFFKRCRYEPNPQAIIDSQVSSHQVQVRQLMEEIRALTMRLGVGDNLALPGQDGPAETRALATIGRTEPIENYKKALVKAKEKTLPDLFKKVKKAHEGLTKWMTASLIPLKAQSESLDDNIEKIEKRIFSVELYAGLKEQIVEVKKGEPAAMTEPIHLMQRRCYMDEECLAAYEHGGMDFDGIEAFDTWLTRPDNLDRLLPFPRCIAAFQVRRDRKERHFEGGDYLNLWHFVKVVLEMEEADKMTFLYIRNGSQVFCLRTRIEFGFKLFPDLDRQLLNAGRKLWAKDNHYDEWEVITEDEYLAIKKHHDDLTAADQKKYDEWEALPKDERKSSCSPSVHYWYDRDKYHPYNQESVYYDDITTSIRAEMERHNRLVLVLQGLLDRSPVLHPHPPWSLWNGESFAQALVLHYDNDRALTTGDPPDFEAYRSRLNASIAVGTITVGQHASWQAEERKKDEEARRYRRQRPSQGAGPGTLAHVVCVEGRGTRVMYQWTRKTSRWGAEDERGREIGCRFTTSMTNVLNVAAYKPGDFKQFYADPRTRAEYLKWAPLLLEAEEFHAGNREVAPVKPLPPRRQTADGAYKYAKRKRQLALVGKAVRLRYEITTRGGSTYKKGSLWRVTSLDRGSFTISGITKDGVREKPRGTDDIRIVMSVRESLLEIDETIPPDPKDGE